MKGHPISQRRACVLIGVDPKTVRRARPPDNPENRVEMHKIAEKRRRFGYRRVGILLERVGMVMNEKKLYRIYREEGLSVRRRRGRKRARGSRTPMPVPLRRNQRWSLDFLSDTFGACRKFRILAVNDDCCRENLALIADTSIPGARVARGLDALVRIYGNRQLSNPTSLVMNEGRPGAGHPLSRATKRWAGRRACARRSGAATGRPFAAGTFHWKVPETLLTLRRGYFGTEEDEDAPWDSFALIEISSG